MEHDKIAYEVKGTPLIKSQSSERIKSLREGHLYAKTLQYYRDLEKETGDDHIGLDIGDISDITAVLSSKRVLTAMAEKKL